MQSKSTELNASSEASALNSLASATFNKEVKIYRELVHWTERALDYERQGHDPRELKPTLLTALGRSRKRISDLLETWPPHGLPH